MVAESQVVVGTEHQNLLSVNRAPWRAGTLQNAEFPVKLVSNKVVILLSQE
jgi:hypothetical protein